MVTEEDSCFLLVRHFFWSSESSRKDINKIKNKKMVKE
jgi:hypothetical protein